MQKLAIIAATLLSACASMPAATNAVPAEGTTNPFARFIGEWTLKDDRFQQVWDGETVETFTVKNHYTDCQPVNTAKSILCVVDAGALEGHIFWAYDDARQELHHLSHFGETRLGTGTGKISPEGDLRNRIAFRDEPQGTYRIYEYKWVGPDEYTMLSTQYSADGTPTGNWYGGTFVRLED
ncbi:hypothetical protein HK107_01355 [Parvularcula sp. ZS-1/3]|uniref:DUF1579 domain-containing protein n=1 Tax=Parvularcula mediterranea TaxID=2732508 RepID=A0A7Y3RIZ9_9PROT|nr:hypothetical protein [Parvularcula mediterranea]NNU14969.1 hypothetical protein [Parvularcula mediterranea]